MANPLAGKIEIDDSRDGAFRAANARFGIADDGNMVLVYEDRIGCARTIKIPPSMLPEVPASGPMLNGRPPIIDAYTAEDHTGNGRRFGPFLQHATAVEVARGRGEWGGDGGVTKTKYVTWPGDGNAMMGVQVLGEPVCLSNAGPREAAVEAVLGSLDPKQRKVMEAALGRR